MFATISRLGYHVAMSRTKVLKKPNKQSSWFDTFVTQHKKLTTFFAILVVILMFIGIGKYSAYQNKFSDKDYAAVENAAEKVMRSVGAEDVKKNEECHYRAPDKYSSIRLYCSVHLAAYMSYQSDAHAIDVAKKLERARNSGPYPHILICFTKNQSTHTQA